MIYLEFFKVIKHLKNLIKVIGKYDNVSKEVINAVAFLLPIKSKAFLTRIFQIETITIEYLLKIIEQEENTGLPGEEKLSNALDLFEQIEDENLKKYSRNDFIALIEYSISFINLLTRRKL